MKKKSLLLVLSVFASAAAVTAVGCGHEHDWQLKSNSDFHWYECSADGEQKDYGAHVDENTDGKCDVCSADVHLHNYTWKHDDERHWQECAYGETANVGYHIDENDDHVCDTCNSVEQVSVTFDMSGIGANKIEQVDYNGKVSRPSDPSEEGLVFGGWYVDSGCKTEFDFNTLITAPKTVYAKWTDVDEAGANPANAHVVAFGGENLKQFGSKKTMYFAYTAAESGRYTLWMTGKTTCTYALSKDKYATVYDDDAQPVFDLLEGETVYVKLLRGSDLTDADSVGVYLSSYTKDALPDSWEDGEYVVGDYSLVLNKENKNLVFTYESETPVSYIYEGGSFDTLHFTCGETKYTVTRNASGDLAVKKGSEAFGTFKLYNSADAVPVEKFEGVYKLAQGYKSNLLEFTFDGNKTVKVNENSNEFTYLLGQGGTQYFTKSNTLLVTTSKLQYYFNLKLDDNGNVVGVTVKTSLVGESVLFNRISDSIPANVPVENDEEFAGHSYTIVGAYGNVYWSNSSSGNRVLVTGYDKATGLYTVTNNSAVLKLKAEVTGNSKKFYIYDSEGTLLDVLNPYTGANLGHELPTAAETALQVSRDEFVKNEYYFVVKTTSWYTFASDMALNATIEMKKNSETSASGGSALAVGTEEATRAVYLTAGSVVRFAINGAKPETVTITVKNVGEAGAPVGSYESNPQALTDVGLYVRQNTTKDNWYYYTFTAPEAGDYLVSLGSGNFEFYVGETHHEAAANAPLYVSLTVTDATQPVKIKVKANSTSFSLRVEEDCSKGTAVTFDDKFVGGTFTESGKYFYEGLSNLPYATNLVLGKADGEEFDITVGGVKSTVSTYSLSSSQLAHGFVLTLANDQTVEYAVNYSLGAEQNPVKITGLGTTNNVLTAVSQTKYFSFTAPEDSDCVVFVNNTSKLKLYLTCNGQEYAAGELCKVAKGTTAVIGVYCKSGAVTSENFAIKVYYDYTDNAQELDISEFSKSDVTKDEAFAVYSNVMVNAGENYYYIASTNDSELTISGFSEFTVVNASSYEHITQGKNGLFTVTIPASENLYVKINSEKQQSLSFVLAYVLGTKGNPYKPKVENTVYNFDFAGSYKSGYMSLPAGTYEVLLSSSATLSVDDVNYVQGELLTVKEDSVLQVVSMRSGIFTSVVPGEFRGKYEYTEGGSTKTLTVSNTKLTIGNIEYTLNAVNGNNYTFVVGSSLSATLTLSETSLKYGNLDLTSIPMFSEDAAQTYTGTVNYAWSEDVELTVTLSQNGEVRLSGSSSTFSFMDSAVYATDNGDGTYSFPYYPVMNSTTVSGPGNGTITFSFGLKGVLTFKYSNYNFGTHSMTPENEFDPFAGSEEVFPEAVAQSYTGKVQMDLGFGSPLEYDFKLSLSKGGQVSFETEAPVTVKGDVTDNGDGTYSFPIQRGDVTGNAKFSFGEGGVMTLDLSAVEKFLAGATLTPTTAFDPSILEPLFPAAAVQTYTGDVTLYGMATNISLTLIKDGTVVIVKNSGYTVLTPEGKVTKDANGTYSFDLSRGSAKGTAKFTFGSNGVMNLDLSAVGCGSSVLAPETPWTPSDLPVEENVLIAGTYKGTAFAEDTVIIISDDLATVTHNGTQATLTVTSDGLHSYSAWNNTYTIKQNGDGTLTITDKYNQTATLSMEVVIPNLPVGTFSGVDSGYTYVLVIKDANTVDFTEIPDGGSPIPHNNCELTYADGKWSFFVGGTKAYFTLNANGSIAMSYYGEYDLNEVAPDLPVGTYVGDDGSGWGFVLSIGENNAATFSAGYGVSSATNAITLSYSQGVWSFTDSNLDNYTFVVEEDGTITLTDAFGSYVLSVPSEGETPEEPEENGIPAGTYVGKDEDDWTYTLIVGEAGSIEYGWTDENGSTIKHSDSWALTSVSDNKWRIDYDGATVFLTLNADGTITNDFDVVLTSTAK